MKRRKLFKQIAALMLGAVMMAAAAGSAFAADSQVTYQGGADAFVVIPEDQDLFQNFKGVMPGDTLTQPVIVKNTVNSRGGVKLYLRAETSDETIKGFLEQMTLTVKQGETILSQAPSDQTAGLTENVLLGAFYQEAQIPLEAILTVPISMGNEFQDAAGTIRWIFTAEELDAAPDRPGSGGGGGSSGGSGGRTTTIIDESVPQAPASPLEEILQEILPEGVPLALLPKTGDPSKDALLLAINIGSLLLIIGLAVRLMRKRKEHTNK